MALPAAITITNKNKNKSTSTAPVVAARLTTTFLLLLLLALAALATAPAAAHAVNHPPPKLAHAPKATAKAAARLAKRDALLAQRDLHDAEKLAVKSLKACLENNPGCRACVPTQTAGLYVCDTFNQGDAACAWPNWVANPRSDGVVNGCTCNNGWGSSRLSLKKYADKRENFVGDAKFLCKDACGAGGTDCLSAVFNPASCGCVV